MVNLKNGKSVQTNKVNKNINKKKCSEKLQHKVSLGYIKIEPELELQLEPEVIKIEPNDVSNSSKECLQTLDLLSHQLNQDTEFSINNVKIEPDIDYYIKGGSCTTAEESIVKTEPQVDVTSYEASYVYFEESDNVAGKAERKQEIRKKVKGKLKKIYKDESNLFHNYDILLMELQKHMDQAPERAKQFLVLIKQYCEVFYGIKTHEMERLAAEYDTMYGTHFIKKYLKILVKKKSFRWVVSLNNTVENNRVSLSKTIAYFFQRLQKMPDVAPNAIYSVFGVKMSITKKKYVNAICAFNADGVYVPPMLVYPKSVQEIFKEDGPDNALYECSLFLNAPVNEDTSKTISSSIDSLYLLSDKFKIWLEHLRRFHDKNNVNSSPIILIVNYKVRSLSMSSLMYCLNNNILLLSAPPEHTTPIETVFAPPLIKTFELMRRKSHIFMYKDFARIFNNAYIEHATENRPKKVFKDSGIYPRNCYIFNCIALDAKSRYF